MNSMFEENREAEHLRLIMSTAMRIGMLGEITSNIRQIQFQYSPTTIHFACYFDDHPTEDEIENISCIETEVYSAHYPEISVSFSIHRIAYPLPLPPVDLKNGGYAYARKEKIDAYNFMELINDLMIHK
jgi:hypothetical protein